ncbi:MAG TPA: TlpA disulfide reductase family protein [Streptosporangiaceae bacterium]|nr:TlpA disulfide reductase family protein [Streptosporangiaceae bacterium]
MPRQSHPTCRAVSRPGLRRASGALTLGVAAALAVAGCSGGPIGENTPQSSGQSFVSGSGTSIYQPGSRDLAPDISGTTLDGKHLKLSDYRGSVVVLNFWGSWCAPCRAEAPGLGTLATRLQSRGVRFLGIDMRDDPTSAEAFMQTFRIRYPSLNDPGGQIALAFRDTVPPAAIPTTLVIDRTGRIAARVIGSSSYNSLRKIILQVATGHPATAAGATP